VRLWGWKEKSNSKGLVIRPPGGENPSMGPGFDEVFGDLKGGLGGVRRVRWSGGVGGVEFGCGSQRVAAVSRDPV
jgi:hypothetical protein